jgi:hypothetical protein
MIGFEQFTTDYDPVEDRIRLSGQDAAGRRASVWLNYRLLGLLVPALVAWLDARVAPLGRNHAAVQQFQQDAAVAFQQAEAAPVPPVDGALAVSVDYTDLGAAMRLTFRDRAGVGVGWMDLPDVALRQWLGILRDLHHAALWPVSAFPDWLVTTGAGGGRPN